MKNKKIILGILGLIVINCSNINAGQIATITQSDYPKNEKQESIEIQNKKEEEAPKPVVEATPEPVEAKPENVSAAAPQEEKKETWSVRFMKKIQEFLEAGES